MFEKQDGASSFFFEQDLKNALEVTDCNRLDFVVVASCHSENAGKIFNKAGVSAGTRNRSNVFSIPPARAVNEINRM